MTVENCCWGLGKSGLRLGLLAVEVEEALLVAEVHDRAPPADGLPQMYSLPLAGLAVRHLQVPLEVFFLAVQTTEAPLVAIALLSDSGETGLRAV